MREEFFPLLAATTSAMYEDSSRSGGDERCAGLPILDWLKINQRVGGSPSRNPTSEVGQLLMAFTRGSTDPTSHWLTIRQAPADHAACARRDRSGDFFPLSSRDDRAIPENRPRSASTGTRATPPQRLRAPARR
jgi:hypothetical protein